MNGRQYIRGRHIRSATVAALDWGAGALAPRPIDLNLMSAANFCKSRGKLFVQNLLLSVRLLFRRRRGERRVGQARRFSLQKPRER